MKDPITMMKRAMGAFFQSRRKSLGWTVSQLRRRTNTSDLQIEKIETGTDSVNTDTLFRVMNELGIGLHLCEQNADEAAVVSMEGARTPPPFLLFADPKSKQLYVLHWQGPAFLVQVVQTIPHTLRIVATYGHFTPAQVHQHEVWADLESYVAKTIAATMRGN